YLSVQAIDRIAARSHAARDLDVAFGERLDRALDLLLDQAAHLDDLTGEFIQISVELRHRMLCHCRPRACANHSQLVTLHANVGSLNSGSRSRRQAAAPSKARGCH